MTVNPMHDLEDLTHVWQEVASETQRNLEARWEQGIALGERIARGFYSEHEEARKTWESVAKIVTNSGDTFGSLVTAGLAAFESENPTQETEALADLLFQQNLALFKTWTSYLVGVQQRQTALARDLSQAAIKAAEALTPAYRTLAKAGEDLLGLAQRSARDVTSFSTNGAAAPAKKKAAAAA